MRENVLSCRPKKVDPIELLRLEGQRGFTGQCGKNVNQRGERAPTTPRAARKSDDQRNEELLGHPETCPHGNPITEAAAVARPAGIPLGDIDSGGQVTIYRITEAAEEDGGLVSYLEARGLRPGARVTILARSESTDSLTLDGPLGRATLGLRPASLIRVLEGEPDPSLFHRVPRRND